MRMPLAAMFSAQRSLCLVLLLALTAVCGRPAPSLALETENLGHVSRVQGEAFALHQGALLPLVHGTTVHRTDVLKTAPGARVEITMLDETRLTLGGDTMLALERYDLGRQQGPGAVLILLTKGAFRVITGQLTALRGGPFEVLTPLATIGVRGTDFWGGMLAPDELGVLLLSGSGVYVRNDGGKSEITRPLEGVRVGSPSAPPPQPSLWSPERRAQALKSVSFN
jgi:Uncharacterized protein conserved in bacteria